MLVTFKSRATPELLMYKEHAKPILDLLGKNVDQGVITVAEMANAITIIEAAMAENRVVVKAQEELQEEDEYNNHHDLQTTPKVASVSFSARAFPLCEMLHSAQKAQREVMWGV